MPVTTQNQLVRTATLLAALLVAAFAFQGCYIVNFFKKDKKDSGEESGAFNGSVIGQSIGAKAGGADPAALTSVYNVGSVHAPAAIRPDPDLYVRRLLRQYRDEGVTIARQIGQVEQYRLLLGGASEDFAKSPQETYDATSLLAVFKVAEDVCRGLVAPDAATHEGWTSILPYGPEAENENIIWLAQRFLGKPSAKIDDSVIQGLTGIMVGEEPSLSENGWARGNAFAKYVPVCATLALDAEALFL